MSENIPLDPETMPDYEDRFNAGEFDGMTIEQIRHVYEMEEIHNKEAEEMRKHNDRINEMDA